MIQLIQLIIDAFKRNRQQRFYEFTSRSLDYTPQYLADEMFDRSFYLNLYKTILWTEQIVNVISNKSKIDYGIVLRTTNPEYDGNPFYQFADVNGIYGCYTNVCPPSLTFNYNQVLTSALKLRQVDQLLPINNLEKLGKILKFQIDLTTYDGAAIANSLGFVDEADIPPIDTWFYVTKKYLYCWIPTLFIAQMQIAIDVEVYDSYEWLEDINPEFNQRTFDWLCNYSGEMMQQQPYKWVKINNGIGYAAIVTIIVSQNSDGKNVIIEHYKGYEGFVMQGYIAEVAAKGYDSWKMGVKAGLDYGFSLVKNNYTVTIKKIEGMHTSTNPTVVAYTILRAFLDKVGYHLNVDIINTLEEFVLRSWEKPYKELIPNFFNLTFSEFVLTNKGGD